MKNQTTFSGQISAFVSAATHVLGTFASYLQQSDDQHDVIKAMYKAQQEYWKTIKIYQHHRATHPNVDMVLRTMYIIIEVLAVSIRKGTVIVPKKELGALIEYMMIIHRDPTLDIKGSPNKKPSFIECNLICVNDKHVGLSIRFTGLPIEFIYTRHDGNMLVHCNEGVGINDSDLSRYGSIIHAYLTGMVPTKGVYLKSISDTVKVLAILTQKNEYHLISNIESNSYVMTVFPKSTNKVTVGAKSDGDWEVVEFPRTDILNLEIWESMMDITVN